MSAMNAFVFYADLKGINKNTDISRLCEGL